MTEDWHSLSDRDRKQLAERGISVPDAERQLALLRSPPLAFLVDRPCTVGDGIRRLDRAEVDELAEAFEAARRAGRATKLVPASGAATRMFRSLSALRSEDPFPGDEDSRRRRAVGDPAAAHLLRLRERLAEFPFYPALQEVLARDGRVVEDASDSEILDALLDSRDLGLADRPKGLIPFHRYAGGEVRSAFEEHLAEGAEYVRDGHGVARFHFTVGPEHRDAFHKAAQLAAAVIGGRDTRFRVELSTQSPATDTLAITPAGEPFRTGSGRLLLRPGGHGALIGNLAQSAGDLVFLKNVDNVLPRDRHAEVARWQAALGGLLVRVQDAVHRLLHRIVDQDDAEATMEGLGWIRSELGLEPPAGADRDWLRDRLERPLRVAGVVENTGEPGGGPFWTRRPDGSITPHIVERAEIDLEREDQVAILSRATHFNPVQIACALRDRHGRLFDLPRFVDEQAVFVARKSHEGRPLVALERPGLWNGAMAGWNTLFVEIPGDHFAPVKTVFDLLRPAHRGS